MIEIGIVGGTGYTGVELLRLLAQHPQANVRLITSRTEAGTRVDAMFPSLRGRGPLSALAFSDPAASDLKACHVVFFATPHGVAMSAGARSWSTPACKIIDLAADFRLKDRGRFRALVQDAARAVPTCWPSRSTGCRKCTGPRSRKARIVGNPGCYPTAVQLGFLPLVEAGIVDPAHLIADCEIGRVRRGPQGRGRAPFQRSNGQLQGLQRRRASPPSGNRPGPRTASASNRSPWCSRPT